MRPTKKEPTSIYIQEKKESQSPQARQTGKVEKVKRSVGFLLPQIPQATQRQATAPRGSLHIAREPRPISVKRSDGMGC